MKYSREVYEKALCSLAELRETLPENERPTLDFVAEAIAEKGDREYGQDHKLGEPLTLEQLREILSATDMAKVACALHELNQYKDLGDLARLRELVEADRDGRCVVLPCKPGDVVWVITERGTRCVERWIVHRVYKRDVGGWYFDLKNMMLSQKRPNEFEMCKRAISSFGKTVFLSKEAAEASLGGE